MKRKTLFLLSILTLSAILLSGCNSADSVDSSETIETIAVESEATEETEVITKTVEEIETEIASEESSNDNETISTGIRDDYPDSDPEHQKAWDYFCNNWNESDYGTTTKGKVANDFPYYGDTGYDPYGTILQYRTTDKGYTVFYDTNTGRVYYSGMTLPTGNGWHERESGAVITQYIIDNSLNNIYDITYAEFQELLGTYAGD